MSDAAIASGLMTLDEFVRRYEQDGPFEIIEGVVVPMSPTVAIHNFVARRLNWILSQHVEPLQLGEVYVEAAYILEYTSRWVKGSRVPDLMFFSAERLAAYRSADADWGSKPFVLVPDLTVEIISSSELYSDVMRKTALYLADGVRLAWVVDPQNQSISVHMPNSAQFTLVSGGDGLLDGGTVLPGFSTPLRAIFSA